MTEHPDLSAVEVLIFHVPACCIFTCAPCTLGNQPLKDLFLQDWHEGAGCEGAEKKQRKYWVNRVLTINLPLWDYMYNPFSLWNCRESVFSADHLWFVCMKMQYFCCSEVLSHVVLQIVLLYPCPFYHFILFLEREVRQVWLTPYKLPKDHNLQSTELSPFRSFMNLCNFGLTKQ